MDTECYGKVLTTGINRFFSRGHRHHTFVRTVTQLETSGCHLFHHHKLVTVKFMKEIDFVISRTLSSSNFFNQPEMGRKGKRAKEMSTNGSQFERKERMPILRVPSFINLVAIGTGGPGTSRCLLLATEHSRYMFNCGEGCQRLILLDKRMRTSAFAKLTGADNVFITQRSWDTLGGLLGLSMTKHKMHSEGADQMSSSSTKSKSTSVDDPTLSLYGPEGIEKITAMSRQFADQSHANIVKKSGEFEDSALKITPVVFYETPTDRDFATTRERSPSPKRSRTDSREEENHHENEVYGYICKVKPPTPKINVTKCVDAGITMGPMVGQLQRGFPVTLEDGRVVHPSQVTDTPNSLDRAFLVIDCPSDAYFSSLEECSLLKQYRGHTDNDGSESFCLVVHMTPAEVLNSPFYRNWMEGFGTDTDHLIMNEEASSADVPRIRTYQAHLNFVNAEVFPMVPVKGEAAPLHDLTPSASEKNVGSQGDGELLKHLRRASFGLIYTIRGKEVGFHTEADDFDLAALHEQIEIPAVKGELETLRELLSSCPTDHSSSEVEYPKVVFLGTGSSQPSAYRSQSFILVHISEDSVVILDCGEDSYGQLYRFYGPSEAKDILRKVKAIFISHLHGDHHMGLVTLLRQRKRAFDELGIPFEPAIVSAPIQMRRWFRFYQKELEEISHLFRCFHHQKFQKVTDGDASFTMVSEDSLLKEVGLKTFVPVEVIHSRGAHGLVMTLNNDFKLVYSGDTRPSLQLSKIGENCDLLIHEATHDDSLLHLAQTAKHSTFSEAMDIGVKMKAKQIILTHFSQRYTHMIPFVDTVPSNVGIAFDNMQVSPKNLPILSKFIPALTAIFDDKIRKNIKHIKSRNNTL